MLEEQARYKEDQKNIRNESDLIDYKRLARLIHFKVRDIDDELARKHFLVLNMGELLEKLRKNNSERKKIQVSLINCGL